MPRLYNFNLFTVAVLVSAAGPLCDTCLVSVASDNSTNVPLCLRESYNMD